MLDLELLHLKELPDEAVLTERQAARLLNISIDTLKAPRPIPRRTAADMAVTAPQRPSTWRSSSLAREASSRLNAKRPALRGRAASFP